jgi:threonine/homoserine/homoserine lactone efflux protein
MDYNFAIVPLLLQGLALGITAAAAPGPFQAFLINQTLMRGFRRSAVIALAPLIADIPIVITILLLLDQLPQAFLRGVSLVGSAFVLYMAWGLWKQWRQGPSMRPSNDPPPSGGLWRGMLMNALSPGPYTFWTLVNGPLLLSALRISWAHGGAFLLGFYGAMITGLVGIAALFHQARRLGPRVVRTLSLASILILVVFGGVLLKRGLLP